MTNPAGAIKSFPVDSLQVLAGLIVVLGLIAFLAWSLRRFQPMSMRNQLPVKIIGTLALSARERITIIEIADQWLVVGISPGHMQTLATLPRQELPTPAHIDVSGGFSILLSRYMDKFHAQ